MKYESGNHHEYIERGGVAQTDRALVSKQRQFGIQDVFAAVGPRLLAS
jgi:hypothetical protein